MEFLSNGAVVGTDVSSPYSFSWTSVASGTYSLTARAVYGASSVASAPVSVTVNAVPSAPINLTATAASTSQINLAWSAGSANHAGLKIERSLNGSTFTQIATVGASEISYSNTGLNAGTSYSYRLVATNAIVVALATAE